MPTERPTWTPVFEALNHADLIDMKRLSGRPEDLLDIAHLSAIERGRKEEQS